MITTIANVVAAPLVERARGLYPKLDIKVFEALSGEISAWHANARFDLTILYLPSPDVVQGATPFLREDAYLLAPFDSARKPGLPIAFGELRDVPLHHRSRIHACRLLDSTAKMEGIDLNIIAELDSIALLYEFTAKRGACTIFPCIAKPPLLQRSVDYRRIVNPGLALYSYIVPGANRAMCRSTSAVIELLLEIAAEISGPPDTARRLLEVRS